jgi:CHAD domain-containing protein
MQPGDALPAVLGNCLEHIQRNEVAVVEGHDPETLHQMRVGVRRLRSALKLFATVAPCPPALLEDIDWLGMELGAARDWDVLLSSTLARMDAAQIELQRWRCKPRTPNGARRRKPCCRRATRG